jgi:hypothetical protein
MPNPNCPSPIWMPPLPVQVEFNQAMHPHADSADAIHDCALRWQEDPLPNSGACRITQFAAAFAAVDWGPSSRLGVAGVGNNVYFFAKSVDGRIFDNRAVLGQGGVGWAEMEGGGRTDAVPGAGAVGTHVFVAVKGLDGNLYLNQADLGTRLDGGSQ